jgi:hypothetical protein
VQYAVRRPLTTSLGIRLFSPLILIRSPYLASPGRPLSSPFTGLLEPLDDWGWDEGTTVWGSYRYPLRVLERVDPWVTSAPPLLFVAGSTFVYERFIVLVPLWSPLESSVTKDDLSSMRRLVSPSLGPFNTIEDFFWNTGLVICRPLCEVSHVLECVGNWGLGLLPVPCFLSTADMPLDRLMDSSFTFKRSSFMTSP